MKVCTRCHQPRPYDAMSRSTGATAGWCLYCVDTHGPKKPRPVCVNCGTEKPVDAMSRSKGATAGWCLLCVDNNPHVKYTPTKRTPTARTGTLPPEALVEFRARYGMTQAGFAKAMRVSVPAVSSWECGKTAVPGVVQLAMSAFVAGLPPYNG